MPLKKFTRSLGFQRVASLIRGAETSPEATILKLREKADASEGDRINLIDAYQRLGRAPDAIHHIRKIDLSSLRSQKLIKFAQYLYEHSKYTSALAAIEEINLKKIPTTQLIAIAELRANVEWDRGRHQGAYEYLRDFVQITGLYGAKTQIMLAGFEDALNVGLGGLNRLLERQEEFENQPYFTNKIVVLLRKAGENDTAFDLCKEALSKWRHNGQIIYQFLDLAWSTGNFGEMDAEILRLQDEWGENIERAAVLGFVVERSRESDAARNFCDKLTSVYSEKSENCPTELLPKIARNLVKLDAFEQAHDIADRYLSRYDLSPLAYYSRGSAKYFMGYNHDAADDLLKCVELNPVMMEAYLHLTNVLPTRKGGLKRFEELLDRRDCYTSRFWTRAPGGRLGNLDQPRYHLAMMTGRQADGTAYRLERPLCQALDRAYPNSYPGRSKVRFSDGRKPSALVIAEDGVGDEVRTAQIYPQLRDRFDEVHVTCEPRFETLFRRSFPGFEFHPVARRWQNLPVRHKDDRSRIPIAELARLVTPDIYDRMPEFSEIWLGGEALLAAKLENGEETFRAREGAFITPDSSRREEWRERIARIANGRKAVGVIWRSALLNARRKKYYFNADQIKSLLGVEGVCYFSFQDQMTAEERIFCEENGIQGIDHLLDLHDDFEGIAAFASELDLVIGTATFNTELAASVGTPCWLVSPSSNFVYYRVGEDETEDDKITWNTRVVRPDLAGGFQQTDETHLASVLSKARDDLSAWAAR